MLVPDEHRGPGRRGRGAGKRQAGTAPHAEGDDARAEDQAGDGHGQDRRSDEADGQGGERERVRAEWLQELELHHAAPEAGRVADEERSEHGGEDRRRYPKTATLLHGEGEWDEQERRVLLARGEQPQRGTGQRPMRGPGNCVDRQREAKEHERLRPGLLEHEERSRLEEDKAGRQFAGDPGSRACEQPGGTDHEREQRVADVAEGGEGGHFGDDGQRRVREGRHATVLQQLRRIHDARLRPIDVRE